MSLQLPWPPLGVVHLGAESNRWSVCCPWRGLVVRRLASYAASSCCVTIHILRKLRTRDAILSCSWHQSTKQPILFSPIFSTNFSQFENSWKHWSKTFFFSVLDRWKVCYLFQLLIWENFVEKIGDNRIRGLVVRCHELIIWSENLEGGRASSNVGGIICSLCWLR